MFDPQVTVVVVPRERFSYTERSLESLYEHTTVPFKLIYVDGNSPIRVKRYLEAQSQQKGFHLIRTEYYLFPNQARNLALSQVDTKYVVFIDNDVLVTPGWLHNLVQCADETGAWVVGPLYLEGEPEHQIIHMAGGLAGFQQKHGRQRFYERHLLARKHLPKVRDKLQRQPIQLIEFHCVLVRTAVFDQLGFLDEKFMSVAEHIDLCLAVREAGGAVYFEPDAIIAYVPPPPLAWSDLPFFFLRWSDAWNQTSVDHLCQKWSLAKDDPFITGQYKWLKQHRSLAFKPLHKLVRRVWQWKGISKIDRYILLPLERLLNQFFLWNASKQI